MEDKQKSQNYKLHWEEQKIPSNDNSLHQVKIYSESTQSYWKNDLPSNKTDKKGNNSWICELYYVIADRPHRGKNLGTFTLKLLYNT